MVAESARGTYLERILANTREQVEFRKERGLSVDLLEALHEDTEPRTLAPALRADDVTIIAEIKRASPSKGLIAPNVPAAEVLRDYIKGGAAAISVLTDDTFFDGSIGDLKGAAYYMRCLPPRVPILRKDFIIDPFQIEESRAIGADAILLIVAALGRLSLETLYFVAKDLHGLDVLVEVHDERELETALDIGATLIGVNNRDLRTFEVDLATTERVARLVPPEVTLVGESGIRTRADVERLGRAGVHAVLVGETLMRAPDRAAALRELLG